METGIECHGTSAGAASSRLNSVYFTVKSRERRFFSVTTLWLRLAMSWIKPLDSVCNFQQLINLGLFKCLQAALQWFGLPWWCAGVWVMRQSWEKSEASPFFHEGCVRAQALVACLVLLSWPQAWLECGRPWLLSLNLSSCSGTVVLLILGLRPLPCPPCQLLCLGGAVLGALHNNCVFCAGELSPWVSHASLLELLPGLFGLRTSVSGGFLRVSKLN